MEAEAEEEVEVLTLSTQSFDLNNDRTLKLNGSFLRKQKVCGLCSPNNDCIFNLCEKIKRR